MTVAHPLNILLIADEAAGLQVLRALARGPHRIAAVVADQTNHAPTSVASASAKLNVRVIPAGRVRDATLAAELKPENLDLILNVHSLFLVCEPLLRLPRVGAFNVHPALLPRYAGLNSVSWAIYRGETTHGVTVHAMEPGIDTGPIAYQSETPIADDDTALSVFTRCAKLGVELVLKLVDAAAANPDSIPKIPQNLANREVFRRKQIPQEGWIDWKRGARDIWNFVRACDFGPFPSPWMFPRTIVANQVAQIAKCRVDGAISATPGMVIAVTNNSARVACGDGSICIERVLIDGRAAPISVFSEGLRLTTEIAVADRQQLITPSSA